MPSQPNDSGISLPDVNVLVALTNPSHHHHLQAHHWLSAADRFATTPITENGLICLLLNPAVAGQPVNCEQAVGILDGLRKDPRAVFVPDTSSLAAAQIDLIGLSGHKQATDFHLINLAAVHACVLVTFDRRIEQSLVPADQRLVRVLR